MLRWSPVRYCGPPPPKPDAGMQYIQGSFTQTTGSKVIHHFQSQNSGHGRGSGGGTHAPSGVWGEQPHKNPNEFTPDRLIGMRIIPHGTKLSFPSRKGRTPAYYPRKPNQLAFCRRIGNISKLVGSLFW